ncbi:hypothetical protein HPB50_017710 [Hyalomma asiaticum]|uniref:Uncharacterized protein n=1 Tax=Hyalomma asiaticum TaxID=266040 RepID=A0ACB7SM64_HYAAI|nr:hypothetical protein HPB50_017710 [Hyalomma asiaticum]
MADVNRLRRIKRSCQKMRSCRRLGVLRAVVIPSEPPDRSSRVRNDRPVTPQEGSMTARWCFGLASPLAVTVKPLLRTTRWHRFDSVAGEVGVMAEEATLSGVPSGPSMWAKMMRLASKRELPVGVGVVVDRKKDDTREKHVYSVK